MSSVATGGAAAPVPMAFSAAATAVAAPQIRGVAEAGADAPAGMPNAASTASLAAASEELAPDGDDEEDTREHFIPVRKSELLELLLNEDGMTPDRREEFKRLYTMLGATFHFEYHDKLEQLKDDYALFDPDADTKPIRKPTKEQKKAKLKTLMSDFIWLLERANFRRLSKADIQEAMKEASEWGINLKVDFGAFEELEIFSRGDAVHDRVVPYPYFGIVNVPFKPRKKAVQVPIYQRLVILLRLKPGKHVPKGVDTDSVHVKVFKDIPKMDLEMLLPATRVNMSLWDRLKLGFSFSSALGMGGYKAAPLVGLAAGASMSLTATVAVAGGCVGYGVRSFFGYLSTKQKYQLALTQSLYFLNLDNNAGVLFRLLDEAEEQECRETMLAYYFLWREPKAEGWTEKALDKRIEAWIKERTGLDVNMEIDDAVGKLRRLKLVEEPSTGKLRAIPIEKALEILDYAWDNHFQYNNGKGSEAVSAADPEQSVAMETAVAVEAPPRLAAPAVTAVAHAAPPKPALRPPPAKPAKAPPASATAAFHAAVATRRKPGNLPGAGADHPLGTKHQPE